MMRGVGILAVLAAAMVLPFVLGNDFYINMASQVLIYALTACGLNLLIGFGGMTSLGHAAYLGISAYACAWLSTNAGWPALPAALAALAIGTASAAVFGVLALRAAGLGFMMITLALGMIVWGMAYRWVGLTGGDNGIRLQTYPTPFGFDVSQPMPFYYFTLCVFVLAFTVIWLISRSPFGACLKGTRDQPRRMRMLGHNVWLIRWTAFILAGFWGSLAGLMYIYYHKFVSPQSIHLQQSAEVLLMVILGGPSSLFGPLVGAAVITLVKNVVSTYVDRWYSLLGLIFIVTVLFMPQGIVPGCQQIWRKITGRGRTKAVMGTPQANKAPIGNHAS